MNATVTRRLLLQGALCGTGMLALPTWAAGSLSSRFAQIEQTHGITLGVWALDTATGHRVAYREQARFAFCSTFKVLLAAAVLQHSQAQPDLLARRVRYGADALVVYSPVTERHVETGMTVAELCAAALQYSDNTAGNLLLELVGGPARLTAFVRGLGDPVFRLDRNEPTLNTALPDDPRDTSSAQAMGMTLQRLALGDALAEHNRTQLQAWLKGNTTGASRIRAGVPQGWEVGDKTGSGDYGVANDIGIVWPPARAPWVLAVFTRAAQHPSPWRNEAIAAATAVVTETFG